MPLKPIPPVGAETIPSEWIELVRKTALRDGHAVRGSGRSPIIEIKSLTTNLWHPLGLPGGGTEFVSYEDRNLILKRIQNA